MKKPKKLLVTGIMLVLVCICNMARATGQDIYPFALVAQQQQFQQLTYELRCLVCQNQSLAESNASLAADLRREIAEKINSGETNQQIIHYLVSRYGDFILYKPPLTQSTYLLWFGPFGLLAIGLLVLVITIRRKY